MGGDAAIERCVAGSLLDWSVTGDAVIMHRLLARILRERDQARGQWVRTVAVALNLLEPLLFSKAQAWSRREEGARLGAQVEALWEADAGAGTADRDLALRQLRARSWAVHRCRPRLVIRLPVSRRCRRRSRPRRTCPSTDGLAAARTRPR